MSLSRQIEAPKDLDHEDLTSEQFIEKVARVIALARILEQQIRTGQAVVTQESRLVGVTMRLGAIMITGVTPVLVSKISGEQGKEYGKLQHLIEEHSDEAQATAATDARVAKAVQDYSMFGRLKHAAANRVEDLGNVSRNRFDKRDRDEEDHDNNQGQREAAGFRMK